MNKIIPFKKEIEFNTKISEISSVSLEHKINSINNDLISGEFIIEGEYKIIEGSINKESYKHVIPFDIAIGPNYNLDNVSIDIDNFYYDIMNDKILKVNIDLSVNNIEEVIEPSIIKEEAEKIEEIKDEEKQEDLEERVEVDSDFLEEVEIENNNNIINDSKIINNNKFIKKMNSDDIDISVENKNINNNIFDNDKDIKVVNNLFNNLNMEETYSTYRVYIVKENDTIDKIMNKYKVTKEDIEKYNDISNIKINDKLIIPTSNEQ